MVLADTSIWVNHLRSNDRALADMLTAGDVACHPFVIGELACGGIRNRGELLTLLKSLPVVSKVADDEVLQFVKANRLWGRGLGLIDMHLLASSALSSVPIWTRDAKLSAAARELELGMLL